MSAAGRLIFHSQRSIATSVQRSCAEAYALNEKLFGRGPERVVVVIAHSVAEWRRACRYYSFPLAKALVLHDGTLVLKSRALTGYSISNYHKVIIHEMNHVFWCALFRGRRNVWDPIWLVEGLACLVARNHYLLPLSVLKARMRRGRKLPLPYRYTGKILRLASRRELELYYSYWAHFAAWLCQGRLARLVAFTRAFAHRPTRMGYHQSFERFFGMSEKTARRIFAE